MPALIFLFLILMSVIIADVRAALRDSVDDINSEITEVLYADDTLIVDEHGELAQIYMDLIVTQGNHYKCVSSIGASLDICVSDVHHLSFNLINCL